MPRKASETSNGEKLLKMFQRLMLQRGKHYQNELAKWLECSPQTVMRLANELESYLSETHQLSGCREDMEAA